MHCELSVLPGGRVVLSSPSGPTTVQDRVRNRKKTVQFSQENNINKILVDMRGQTSLSNAVDIHDFGETMPETTRGFQIAIVCTPGDTDAQFIETVAKNRGAFIKLFHSFDKALDWLTPSDIHSSNKQDSSS